jgi:hypothetical protein
MRADIGAPEECCLFCFIPVTKPEVIGGEFTKKQHPPGPEEPVNLARDPPPIRSREVGDHMNSKNSIEYGIPERRQAGIGDYDMTVPGTCNEPPA